MSYIGRVVGVGATKDGNPVLLYGLSGRSPPSRARIAVVHGSRVAIEPYGEMTPEQMSEAQRLVYDAIMISNTSAIGVVSNGKQTGSIYRGYMRKHDASGRVMKDVSVPTTNSINRALKRWGHEGKAGDRYRTPRTAGMPDAPLIE